MKWIGKCLAAFLMMPLLLCAVNEQYQILHNRITNKPMAYSAMPGDNRKVIIPTQFRAKSGEMRGIWIATYANLDFPKTNTPYEFKQKFSTALIKAKNAGFNTIFFQIRPSCDAFYNSSILPVSKSIRGKEGFGYANLDVLEYMITETHRAGMRFYAWMNPYRIAGSTALSKTQYLQTLSPKNFARMHPECVLSVRAANGNSLLLDPGVPLVRQHLSAVIREIIMKYNPDSIVFDDYFYPYHYTSQADMGTYRKYNKDPRIAPNQWRRNNVNQLIYDTSRLIRENNARQRKKIQFGVSPFGIWLNSKSHKTGSPTLGMESWRSNFCDTILWIRNNWIDYVIPQLYWQFEHNKAPYACLADWWANQVSGTRVKLYIGIGAHQNIAANNTSELKYQILYNQRRTEIDGEVFYSWRYIFEPENKVRKATVEHVVRDCWNKKLP